jgi:prevent-host-death family protein
MHGVHEQRRLVGAKRTQAVVVGRDERLLLLGVELAPDDFEAKRVLTKACKIMCFSYNDENGDLTMQTTRVTASEFQHAFGALSDKARQGPVVITKHGRDSLVVMSAEEWERLKRRDRRVSLTTDLPEEWLEAVRSAKVPDEFASLDAELK